MPLIPGINSMHSYYCKLVLQGSNSHLLSKNEKKVLQYCIQCCICNKLNCQELYHWVLQLVHWEVHLAGHIQLHNERVCCITVTNLQSQIMRIDQLWHVALCTFTSWSWPTPSPITLTSPDALSTESVYSVTAVHSSTLKDGGGEGDHSICGVSKSSTVNSYQSLLQL